MCVVVALVLALVVAALPPVCARPSVGPKQSLFEFQYPFATIGEAAVAYTSFSEVPSEDVRNNLAQYTDLRVILVTNPVTPQTWALDSTIGLLTLMQVLDVPATLRGTLPSQLGLLTDMRFLDVREGGMTGSIPSELGLLTSALAVYVASANLAGTLPSQWGQLTSLVAVKLSECGLSGTIPSQLARVQNATEVSLQRNDLTGTVDPQLFDQETGWRNLRDLDVSQNQLTGTLPSELGACASLTNLQFRFNNLEGTIPSQLGRLGALNTLRLENNALVGSVPSQLGWLTNLQELSLENNALSGAVPSEIGLLTMLTLLLVAHNGLSGTVPPSVFALPLLAHVSTEHNSFEGRIPANAASMWRGDCDYSGLDHSDCLSDCPACSAGFFQLVECGPAGQKPTCVEWWWVLIALVGCLLVCSVLARSVHPASARPAQLFMTGVFSTFSTVDLAVDFLFALNAEGVVQTMAFASWGVVVCLTVVASLGVCYVERLRAFPARLAGASVLGILNVATLIALTTTNLRKLPSEELRRQRRFVSQVVLVLTISEALSQGALQLSSVLLGDRSTITILSLCFSAFHVLSMFTVGLVLALAHDAEDPGARAVLGDPAPSRGQRRTARRRLAAVFALLFPALVHHQLGLDHTSVERAWEPPAISAMMAVVPDVPLPTADFPLEPQRARVATKSAFECPASVQFDARLPLVCSFGQLVVLFYYQLQTTPSDDFPAIIAEHPPLVAIVSLSRQVLGSDLGLLPNLAMLFLENSESQLPSQVGQLSKLLLLRHSRNTVENFIPSELGNARRLLDLSMVTNGLVGSLPSQLGLLTDLAFLDFYGNPRLSGALPSQLGNLRELWNLDLSFSLLSGPLPSEIGNWGDMKKFVMDAVLSMTGTLPSQIGRWGSIERLRACDSEFSGSLPTQLYTLTTLTELSLCSDGLRGTIASELGGLLQLGYLELKGHGFEGTVPTQLARLTSLETLIVAYGGSPGTVPSQLARLTTLKWLALHDKQLRGTIPSELGLLTTLTSLQLSDNRLHGTLPTELARLTALIDVAIFSNELSGVFPAQFNEAAKAVWGKSCDYSGVKDRSCRRACRACPFGSLELRGCDPWGFDQVCVPPYVLLLGLVCFCVLDGVVVKRVGKARFKNKAVAQGVLVSLVSAAHFLFDWVFAMDAGGVLRGLAVAVLCAGLLARLVLVAAELLRLQRREAATEITSALFLLVATVAVCVVDPFTLKRALRAGEGARAKLESARVVRRVLVVVLLCDVPMLVLQIVRLSLMATPDWVVATALACTLLSIAVGTRYWPCVRHVAARLDSVVTAVDQPRPLEDRQL